MKVLILGYLLAFLLASCKPGDQKSTHAEILAEFISSNEEITDNLTEAFNIDEKSNSKVFKMMVSRRDQFVRITIYQVASKSSLSDLPSGYFYYKNDLFLFFDGSEAVYGEKISEKDLEIVLSKSNFNLDSNQNDVYDSPIVQFDIDPDEKISFNFPPINPYDLKEVPADPRWQSQGRKDSL